VNSFSRIREVLVSNPKLAAKLGLTTTSPCLGHGIVFQSRRGTAVKLTRETSEARIAKKFLGKELKHVVRVLGVHELVPRRAWLIEMELLHKKKAPAAVLRECFAEGAREIFQVTRKLYTDMIPDNIMFCARTQTYKIIDFEAMHACAARDFEELLADVI